MSNTYIRKFKEDILSNLWVTPVLMSIFSVILLLFAIYIDSSLNNFNLYDEYLVYRILPGKVSNILSVMVSASITITSITLSVTVLTLSLASNQLGPRLLPNFIRQSKTQNIIGIFLSLYLYSTLLLVLINSQYFHNTPMFISIIIGIALSVVAFFALIYFIHHVSRSIQTDYVLSVIFHDTADCMDRMFSDEKSSCDYDNALFQCANKGSIRASNHGYIQTIDYEKIKGVASYEAISIELLHRPGSYINKNALIAYIYGHSYDLKIIENQINKAIGFGTIRTSVQDVEFGFDQVSEIAVRALSPSTNNPYTAIQCINIIGDLLVILASKKIKNSIIDNQGKHCVVCKRYTYESIIDISLNSLRQHAAEHVNVIIELLRMIKAVLRYECPNEMYDALVNQAHHIYEASKLNIRNKHDKQNIDKEYKGII